MSSSLSTSTACEVPGSSKHEYHQAQVARRCRVCAQTSKNIYMHLKNKPSYPRELKAAFGVEVDHDIPDIHPACFCYLKMKKYNKKNMKSAVDVFDWQPHAVMGDCSQCRQFREQESGGRPPKATSRGRPKSRDEPTSEVNALDQSACPSWSSPQTLSLSSFLPPVAGVQLSDLQCPFCSFIVDRPIQAACGKVVCCKCITEYMQQNGSDSESFPCCGRAHISFPIPAAAVIVQVVGSLLLRCSTCQRGVELRVIREHRDSGCIAGSLPSSSQQTVDQILSRPLDAPPTTAERKLATAVIKRMINSPTSAPSSSTPSASPTPSSLPDLVSLPTGGQVSSSLTVHTFGWATEMEYRNKYIYII